MYGGGGYSGGGYGDGYGMGSRGAGGGSYGGDAYGGGMMGGGVSSLAQRTGGTKGPNFVPGKVFVGGVAPDTSSEGLAAYCGQWGEVADVHVMKGYAFVTFREVPSAQAFLEHREHFIDGRKVDVKAAVPKDQGGSQLTKKMFVGGTGEINDDDFREYFAQFGNIVDCVVLRKPDGGSRGFGFVTYDDEISVEKCLVMPHMLNGKTVEVKRAVGKEQDGSGRGPRGGMGMGMGMGGPRGGMGYGGMGYGGMGGGMGGGMAGGDRTGKAPDWICSECTNKNFGWRQFCNRCKVPKPAGAGMGGAGMMGGMGGLGTGMMGMGGMGAGMMGMGAALPMAGAMGGAGAYDSTGLGGMGGMGSMMGGMGGMGGMGYGGLGAMGGMLGSGMGAGMGTGMGATGMGSTGMGTAGMGGASMGGGMGAGASSMGTGVGMGGMGAGDGMGAGGGYGRMNGGRGSGGQQQRYRPY